MIVENVRHVSIHPGVPRDQIFEVGDQEIGLDPNGHNAGMTGPVGYGHVNDIQKSLQLLADAGAQVQQKVKDVGGGKLIASVKDADNNIVGLIQSS